MPRVLAQSGQIVTESPFSVVRYLTSEASILRAQDLQTSMDVGAIWPPLKRSS